MAKGAYYPIYQTLYLYSNAAQAQTYGSNYASTLSPNTGSDASSYNCISSVEGKGNCYVDTSVGMTAYYPAFPVWWVPSGGGSGYLIGWTNDSKNARKSTVSIPSSATIGDKVKLTINRQSTSFTHKVYVWVNGAYLTLTSSAGASYTWDTSQYANTLISDISNAASKKFEMKVETYNGSTFIGSVYPSVTLSIPVSAPTVNKTTVEAGTVVRITTNRLNSAFKHVLYWRINGGSGWTTIATGVENFCDWTPAVTSVCNALPNATSGVFNIMVETYNGSTFIGSESVNITITIPASVVPSISIPNVTETNSKIKDTLGYTDFVSGISTYSVLSTTRTAGQGATINAIQYKLGTYSYQYPPTLTTARAFGTMTGTSIVVYAFIVDSRGRKATVSKTISQTPYYVPSITGFSASRYNDTNKTQVQVVLKATQTKLSDKNTMRYKLEYKKATETSWKQLKAYSSYQLGDFNITTVQTIANDAKYNIRVSVQDKIGNTTTTIFTVKSTSRKWLEVTNGENINVIGNLKNNGSQVLTQDSVKVVKSSIGGSDGVALDMDLENGFYLLLISRDNAMYYIGVWSNKGKMSEIIPMTGSYEISITGKRLLVDFQGRTRGYILLKVS